MLRGHVTESSTFVCGGIFVAEPVLPRKHCEHCLGSNSLESELSDSLMLHPQEKQARAQEKQDRVREVIQQIM